MWYCRVVLAKRLSQIRSKELTQGEETERVQLGRRSATSTLFGGHACESLRHFLSVIRLKDRSRKYACSKLTKQGRDKVLIPKNKAGYQHLSGPESFPGHL